MHLKIDTPKWSTLDAELPEVRWGVDRRVVSSRRMVRNQIDEAGRGQITLILVDQAQAFGCYSKCDRQLPEGFRSRTVS